MDLPEIFKNKLDDDINNNERTFMSFNSKKENKTMEDIIMDLPIKVRLKTKSGNDITTIIIGKTKNYIVTNNRNVININDIKDIKKL